MPEGLKATLNGKVPTVIVPVTVLVVVSIIETLLLSSLATYTNEPVGLTATPHGLEPTVTVAVTEFVEVSTTFTLPPPLVI